uniref:Peptidase S1 domain-containing protein n=1 Tax=Leptobrachium leishanense TaxID=445787 RepID=A0A8C5Q513_9ANUR
CGFPVISSRVVGGSDAVHGEWPWQALVQFEDRFTCGGSLINEQWVLSAAHCVKPPSQYAIALGMLQTSGSNPHSIVLKVDDIMSHPAYTKTGSKGDIALMRLSSPVTYTDYIRPICLPSSSVSFPCGLQCWVTGWGTRTFNGNLSSPNILQKMKVPLIDHRRCDEMYHVGSATSTNVTIVKEEEICAGYKEDGNGYCQGDSGGPLVCKVNGTWFQAGIVSRGDRCASPYHPGVYTLVPAYESWIKKYVSDITFSNVTKIPSPSPQWSMTGIYLLVHIVLLIKGL